MLKNCGYIICLSIFWIISGCQTNSTFFEQQVILEDQAFTLSEKSPKGTLVGQVVVTGSGTSHLSYFLVSNNYSQAFNLNDSTGKLFLLDSSAINYKRVQQIDLEVMVGYSGTVNNYGVFANIKITIIDTPDQVIWSSNGAAGSNQDAIVNSLQPSTNFSQPELYEISAWSVDLQPVVIRSFLQFDMTAIPVDAEITSAYLYLKNPNDSNPDHFHSTYSGSNAFFIRKVASEWNSQTLTWNNQPAYITQGQILAPASQQENQDYTVDVTEMVKEMIKHPQSNFGFMMMLEDENRYRRVCFASLENIDVNLRPKLEINYLF
jgi:hypothetical protein